MPPPDHRVLRALRNLPLAATGLVQRFGEDPARGRLALARALRLTARSPRGSGALAALDRAVAADRWSDAMAALDDIPTGDAALAGARLAVAGLAGDLGTVAAARASDRRGRRAVAHARSRLAVLRDELPAGLQLDAAPAPRSPGTVLLHVVTNSLPRVQAGSTIRTQRLLRAQRDLGWDARGVTRPGFPVLHGVLDAAPVERVDGVPYHRLLPPTVPSPGRMTAEYVRLLEACAREVGAGVLHGASDHLNGRAALEVARRTGAVAAYEVRAFPEDTWLARHPAPHAASSDAYLLQRARHDEVLRSVDLVTTLGEHMRDEVVRRGVSPDRVFVVPNAVDAQFCRPPRDVDAARRRLGIARGDLLLGSVTTMYEYEGLDTIIRAAGLLRTGGIDARVLIAGSGPCLHDLRHLADTSGVPLTLPGQIPVAQVADYFDALDVFALPRTDDLVTRTVTGLKPLEAQARGVPVVGSDLPAVIETLAPGSQTVRADDVEGWAEVLSRYADVDHARSSGQAAREWVLAHRTWPEVVLRYREAYARAGVAV